MIKFNLKKGRSSHKGFALALVLLLMLIGTLILSSYISSVTEGTRIRGVRKRGIELRLAADSGLQLGIVELNRLLEKAQEGDFSNFPSDCVNAGLVPGTRTENVAQIQRPISDESGTKVELNVFFIADEKNGSSDPPSCADLGRDSNTPFPKVFTIVSTATNAYTGQSYTVESRSRVGFGNWSEFSFAMRNPVLPPNATRLEIMPATIEGRVHFGLLGDPDDKIYFAGWTGTKHLYRGPFTFQRSDYPDYATDLSSEYLYPFEFSTSTNLTFEKGYKTSRNPTVDTADFAKLAAKADYTLPGGAGDRVCLKFLADGSAARYACFNDANWGSVAEPNYQFWYRYVGEVATDYSGVLAPLETYSTANTIFFSNADISVKGIVNGQITVATTGNIILEGDIQYNDQTSTSLDMAGFIAQKDIIIPHGVPMGISGWDGSWMGEQDPSGMWFATPNGLVNAVVSNDRNLNDADYVNPPTWPTALTRGQKNSPQVLDLDGMFLAAEGGLVVDGINNWTQNPTNGVVIPAFDGNTYTTETGKSDSYYYIDGSTGKWTRRSPPLYCYYYGAISRHSWNRSSVPRYPAPCMLYDEMPRPDVGMQKILWIYGGLVVNEFTYTNASIPFVRYTNLSTTFVYGPLDEWNKGKVNGITTVRTGFDRRVIKYDSRLSTKSPPGFFSTGESSMTREWKREYPGSSKLLTGN